MKARALHLFFIAWLIAGLGLAVQPVPPAYAATIDVTTNTDVVDANGGACLGLTPGDLPGPDGFVSLREAICAANSSAKSDTINVPAGTYTLTLAGAKEDASATGDLDITAALTIVGAGAGNTIIDGNNSDRVFEIMPGITATISNVTVRNGNSGGVGGGGGIFNAGGTLTLNSSTVSGNTAADNGGGILNYDTLTVTNSTISGNTAANFGGGILGSGTLTVTNSTVSGNTASNGGGILGSGTLTVTNSTVSGNTATGMGGGIFNAGGTTTLGNTLVAAQAIGADCFLESGSIITSDGYNLDSDGSCGLGAIGDQPSTNPNLGPLADNGGPTWTHALPVGSPAIDTGDPNCPGADQRGVDRPLDGDGDTVAACDSGAYEYSPPPPPPTLRNPTDGSSTHKLKFKWNKVEGAEEYQIQVDDDPNFGSPAIDATSPKNKYKPDVMPPFDYYWRVRARAAGSEWGGWSDVWTFQYTILKKPGDNSTTEPGLKFKWRKVKGAEEYQIQVADNPNFDTTEIDATIPKNKYEPVDPFAPGTYYWRVQVRTEGGWQGWTPGWAFTVVAP